MPSYTPQEHADVTVWAAMKEGFVSGGLAAIPSTLAVYAAMNFSPKFVKVIYDNFFECILLYFFGS